MSVMAQLVHFAIEKKWQIIHVIGDTNIYLSPSTIKVINDSNFRNDIITINDEKVLKELDLVCLFQVKDRDGLRGMGGIYKEKEWAIIIEDCSQFQSRVLPSI